MAVKARVNLQQAQAEMLIRGRAVTVRLPGADVTEIELTMSYVSPESTKAAADTFASIGKKRNPFEDLFGDYLK